MQNLQELNAGIGVSFYKIAGWRAITLYKRDPAQIFFRGNRETFKITFL